MQPAYLKDDPALAAVAIERPVQLAVPKKSSAQLKALCETYNALGGLIDALSASVNVSPYAVLAVWYRESGTLPYVPGHPVLRFENHKFYKYWGKANKGTFDDHFQFGGRAKVKGKPATHHAYRRLVTDPWSAEHGDGQAGEYEVLDFALTLAPREACDLSASWGGPQIMGFNYPSLGYPSAEEMVAAFGADIRWQVIGFFDFCAQNGLLGVIRKHKWTTFGARYNGDGKKYGGRISRSFAIAQQLAKARPK